MTAPGAEALQLQRPLPADALKIVAKGLKEDGISNILLPPEQTTLL